MTFFELIKLVNACSISWIGTNHALSLNGGDVDVELKTVSGDIYLRGK